MKRVTFILVVMAVMAVSVWGQEPRTAEEFFNRGMSALNGENFTQAIEAFTEVIRLNPNNSDAYYRRGKAYHDLARTQLEHDESNFQSYWKNFELAKIDLETALRINPNHPDAAIIRVF